MMIKCWEDFAIGVITQWTIDLETTELTDRSNETARHYLHQIMYWSSNKCSPVIPGKVIASSKEYASIKH